MFRNYLTVAWRNLVRHKLYSAINIVGLAIGLTCMILAVLFIRDELSYDRWIPGTQNLYRIEFTVHVPGRSAVRLAAIPYPMAAAMRNEVPGVTAMTRLYGELMTVTRGDREFVQQINVVDPDFFGVIRLPLLAGNPSSVFRQPQSVVLSESAAKRYFGSANPIGQVLTVGSACSSDDVTCRNLPVELTVTGVMRNLPHNTQLSGDMFVPNTSRVALHVDQYEHDWLSEHGWGFVKLSPGVGPAAVVANPASVLDRDATPTLRRYGIQAPASQAYQVHLTRFTDVHLSSARWQGNLTPAGSWTTVYGVAAVGVLILLTATFNFMNLATALALVRSREIAVRKIVGARRRHLIVQFLGEAVLVALLSLALALSAAEMLLPSFDKFVGHPTGLSYVSGGTMLLVLIGISVVTGLVSGSYPALVLSGFRPLSAFRPEAPGRPWHVWVRNFLVLLQFAVSVALGISAGVVFSQIHYARHIELGFRHHDMLVIGNGSLSGRRQDAFVDALRSNPGVESVGLSSLVPFESGTYASVIRLPGRPDITTFNTVVIGPQYPATYGIPVVAGRALSASRVNDRLSSMAIVTGGDPGNEGRDILINATAARRLGFSPQEAVGKTVEFNHNHVHIVGVLADAKIDGALAPVKPTAYIYVPNSPMLISVHLRPGSIPQTLSFIDQTWHSFVPTVPILRFFLDQSFGQLYQRGDRQGTLFGVLVVIAVLIGCLGLYGLAVFTAERRTKEIGIRKVSGARTRDVLKLMLWRISVPVLVANIVAWPVAYLYLRHWLDGFAYRIPLDAYYFMAAGAAALLIAWATVMANTVRLARRSPIHALRYE